MNDEPDGDRLPDRLREAARDYHTPPPVPREEMWAAIAAERARRRAVHRVARPLRWGLALAATLVLGIGIGRVVWRERPEAGPSLAERVAAAAGPSTAYRVAAAQYVARTEVLLTTFRTESGGQLDPQFIASARELLTTTRLMLDSPAAHDQRLAALLQDLELVLAQIAQLPAEPGRQGEMDLITQSMTQSRLLPRLRAETAAGSPARTQGAL